MSLVHAVVRAVPGRDLGLRGRERIADQREAARDAVLTAAGLSGLADFEPRRREDGSPLPQDDWRWSHSHCRRAVGGTLARGPVGIDVEHVHTRKPELVACGARPAELELLRGDRWQRFFAVWTAKEAVLKKLGVGLAGLPVCEVRAVLVAPDGARLLRVSHAGEPHVVHQLTREEPDGLYLAALSCDPGVEVAWDVDLTAAAVSAERGARA